MSESNTLPTVAEVDGWIQERRRRIAEKSAALEVARQQAGELALAGDVAPGPHLAQLQAELEVERLALGAAEAKRPAALRQQRLDHLARLEQSYAERQARIEELEPRVKELQAELGRLLPELTHLVQGNLRMKDQINTLKAQESEVLQ